MRTKALFCVWLVACALLAGSCGSDRKQPIGVCFAKRAPGNRPVTPADWAKLIVQLEPSGGSFVGNRDCTGLPIHWTPPPSNCIVKTPPLGTPQPVPLTEESVVERMLPGDHRLVWVMTHRFANGDGYGPVALVRIYPRGLAVEAIGPLRLRRERVGLELWRIGGREIMVAQGETCHDKKDAGSCHRAANVLVLRKHAFLDPPITYPDGQCIDVPWIELVRQANLPIEGGWNRHFEITSSLSHDERYFVITEQLRVEDSDPDQPDVPPRPFRKADTERFIHLEEGALHTRQHPMWPKALPTEGKTEVTDPSKL
jgi:hypothetical protein